MNQVVEKSIQHASIFIINLVYIFLHGKYQQTQYHSLLEVALLGILFILEEHYECMITVVVVSISDKQ